MNRQNVKLVFLREVRDQLRDRRTLFMVVVLPLLLYPGLLLGMLQMRFLFEDQPRTIVIIGAENLPEPPLVQNHRFLDEYFDVPADADKLDVITDATESSGSGGFDAEDDRAGSDAALLATAHRIRGHIDEIANLEVKRLAALSRNDRAATDSIDDELENLKSQVVNAMSSSGLDVLILVPDGFREHVADTNRQISERSIIPEDVEAPPRLQIVRNSADDKSLVAYRRVKDAVSNWEQTLLQQRLAAAQLSESLLNPINPDQIDVALEDQLAANIWSKVFPALLIIMTVTGAFYPAIDLGAGEKERGTMETLLISPARRTEIVSGKFLTVLLFSISTAMLNLISIGMTGRFASFGSGADISILGEASLPSFGSVLWVIVLALPMAALFSSLSLGLAMFARSSKEGQYYLTPLLMVTMGLAVVVLTPMYEITPFFSVMPVLGPALLLKAMLLSPTDMSTLYSYIVPVLVSSIGYCVLGLWWAVELFRREDVLFRGDDQFEFRLWIKHVLRDKDPLPSFSEGVFCFVLIMLLQFASMGIIGREIIGAGSTQMLKLLIVQQLVVIATPALLMAVMLTTSWRRTLKLTWPPAKYFAIALLLAIVLRPLSVELVVFLQEINFLPALDESIRKQLAEMLDPSQAGWLAFLAIAVAPGICEELAFRGFILSAFSRAGRTTLAIVLSAMAFGVMHLIPQQVFNASLLGLVLGLIAIRSGSLLPGILFHILYNGGEVLKSRISEDVWTSGPARWFFEVRLIDGQTDVGHTWLTLGLCALVASVLIVWLVRDGESPSPDETMLAGQASWAT